MAHRLQIFTYVCASISPVRIENVAAAVRVPLGLCVLPLSAASHFLCATLCFCEYLSPALSSFVILALYAPRSLTHACRPHIFRMARPTSTCFIERQATWGALLYLRAVIQARFAAIFPTNIRCGTWDTNVVIVCTLATIAAASGLKASRGVRK
ncbi:hypothetical protein K438DRAFT_1985316 [Mycena galopus ATCC 62051]|nr:hypothetical protein K438DRAFT_1985316 [Mycena galopus ATCC 62051]